MFAMFDITSLLRKTFTSRKRLSVATAGSSIMDIASPRRQPVAANLVAHRAQAYPQHFGGAGAVASSRVQGDFQQPLLHALERHSRAHSLRLYLSFRAGRARRRIQLAGLEHLNSNLSSRQ